MTDIENKQPGNRDAYRIIVMLDAPYFDEIADACKKAGHEVVRVSSTDEMSRFLETKDHADLVVSAAFLESENVFELLRTIKNSQEHAEVRIMLICTDPNPAALALNESTQNAALTLGADLYLFLPNYDKDRIIQEIEAALPLAEIKKAISPTRIDLIKPHAI